MLRAYHRTLAKVTEDIEALAFNTAVSAMMEFVNEATGWDKRPRDVLSTFVLLLALSAACSGEGGPGSEATPAASPPTTEATATATSAPPGLSPALWDFVRHSCHLPAHALQSLAADALPEPARHLLVHTRDMTSTLADFHGRPLRVEVLQHVRQDTIYLREVFLRSQALDQIVEYGVIAITWENFTPPQREAIQRIRRLRAPETAPETELEEGDVVVLLGDPEAITAAEERLLQK